MIRAVAGTSLVLAMAGVAPSQRALALESQIDASTPAFEVASVKVSAPLPNGVMMFRFGGLPASTDPGRVDYQGVTLKNLVARAYGVKDYQVEGPQWLDGEHYDVIATIPEGADKSQVGPRLQRLLAERFNLTLHHESKPMAVYTLSVAKGGPKLKEIDPDKLPPPPVPGSAPIPPPVPGGAASRGPLPAGAMRIEMGINARHLRGNGNLTRICSMLSNLMDRPVTDLTDLKGTYEFDLSWAPDENERMGKAGMMMMQSSAGPQPSNGGGQPAPESAGDPLPTLAQALQTNYGLKLEARKNPVDILVIDRAEKVPTEN